MRRLPAALVLLSLMGLPDGGRSAQADGWQENFAYEKVALLERIDAYRLCVATALSREIMASCRY